MLAKIEWVSAPRKFLLHPPFLRATTAGRMALSARLLVGSAALEAKLSFAITQLQRFRQNGEHVEGKRTAPRFLVCSSSLS